MEEKLSKCGKNLDKKLELEALENSDNPAADISRAMDQLAQWAQHYLHNAPCKAQPDAQMRRVRRWGSKLSDRLTITNNNNYD